MMYFNMLVIKFKISVLRLLLIAMLCSPALCSAQFQSLDSSDIDAPMQPNEAAKANIKVSCLSALEALASVKLAVEMPVSKYVTAQVMAGYYFRYAFDREKLDPAKKSYNLALEGRYYIPNKTLYGLYAAGRLGYNSVNFLAGGQKATLTNSDTTTAPVLSFNFDSPWKYHRDEFSAYLLVGLQSRIIKLIALDIDLGLVSNYTIDKRLSPTDSYKGITLPAASTKKISSSVIYGLSLGYFF